MHHLLKHINQDIFLIEAISFVYETFYTVTQGYPSFGLHIFVGTCFAFFLYIYLSILVSLILEHYTRECEFGNFDKI